ncbi:MAG: hypothetical protein U0525_05905 [Patescibacteria group bacterium]
MTVVEIGPCEGIDGCVREAYLEALVRYQEVYGEENVTGGPVRGCCAKHECPGKSVCSAKAVIIYVDRSKNASHGNIFDGLI